MNRKERRANERQLRKNKKREQSILAEDGIEITKIADDHYEVDISQAEFNKWVRDSSYSDVFWQFAETQMVESYERTNPGKHIKAPIERRSHDGFYFPFVEGLNPEDLIGYKIKGDLTKKWIFIALLTHAQVGAFSFEREIKNHEHEAMKNIKSIGAYTKF